MSNRTDPKQYLQDLIGLLSDTSPHGDGFDAMNLARAARAYYEGFLLPAAVESPANVRLTIALVTRLDDLLVPTGTFNPEKRQPLIRLKTPRQDYDPEQPAPEFHAVRSFLLAAAELAETGELPLATRTFRRLLPTRPTSANDFPDIEHHYRESAERILATMLARGAWPDIAAFATTIMRPYKELFISHMFTPILPQAVEAVASSPDATECLTALHALLRTAEPMEEPFSELFQRLGTALSDREAAKRGAALEAAVATLPASASPRAPDATAGAAASSAEPDRPRGITRRVGTAAKRAPG